jgi:hypothetical protein
MNTSNGKQLASLPQFSDRMVGAQVSDQRVGAQVSDQRVGAQVSDQRVGAQVSDPRLARAKECEITPKDGAKWGVQRKSPEPRGPPPCRSAQDPPLLSLDEESSSAPSPSCSTPTAYKDHEPPGAPKRKSYRDVLAEDLVEEPVVFDLEALEQALESTPEEFSETSSMPDPPPLPCDLEEGTPCWRETASGIPVLDHKSVNSWIIGKPNMLSVLSWIADVLESFNVEILEYDNENFQWKCQVWDQDYANSVGFTLNLFQDGSKSKELQILVCLVRIDVKSTMGFRRRDLEFGFRSEIVRSIATGGELVPDDDQELRQYLTRIGNVRPSRQLPNRSEVDLLSEYELAEEAYKDQDLDPKSLMWAPREKVMGIFEPDYVEQQLKYSHLGGVPIEVISLEAISRMFTYRHEFSLEDILTSFKKVLFNPRLKWNWYFVCSKSGYVKELLSEREVISSSKVALLREILTMLGEITSSDESSELLWTLATKAKDDLRTFVPQLVKSQSSTTPSGGGGGGGGPSIYPKVRRVLKEFVKIQKDGIEMMHSGLFHQGRRAPQILVTRDKPSQHDSAWVITRSNLEKAIGWVEFVMKDIGGVVKGFNWESFQWIVETWSYDLKSSSTFYVSLFEDAERSDRRQLISYIQNWSSRELIFYVVKIELCSCIGEETKMLERGFITSFLNKVSLGIELLPRNQHLLSEMNSSSRLVYLTEEKISYKNLYEILEASDMARLRERQIEELYLSSSVRCRYPEWEQLQILEDTVDWDPLYEATRKEVMAYFEGGSRVVVGCSDRLYVVESLSRIFAQQEVFTLEDTMFAMARVLSDPYLEWAHYFVCSKSGDLVKMISNDGNTLNSEEKNLLGKIHGLVGEIMESDESSEMLKVLAKNGKEYLGECIPQLVKSASSAPSGCGGGGGGER